MAILNDSTLPTLSGIPPADPVMSVSGLVVAYDGTRVVDGIDFEVRRGEVFGLLGTNGAGKTSTLDVLEGFRRPNEGTVSVFGADPFADHDRIAPRMGIMLQDAGFFEDLTVKQTLRAWCRFYEYPRSFQESVEMVGLEHRVGVRVRHLSGGERRRLDLALALLGHPEVLFLDEPTTGMDPEGRQRCLNVVRDLVADGLTVVLTTHYLEEAEQLADRVAIMHRGEIRAQGTLNEVLAAHQHSTITFETSRASSSDATFNGLLDALGAVVDRGAETTSVSLSTPTPQSDLTRLLSTALTLGITMDALGVSRSTLEDVFMSVSTDPVSGAHS